MKSRGTGIDWDEVKTRLRESEVGLERALNPDRQRLEAVYGRRAAELAARRLPAEATAATIPVLTFALAAERYGIELPDLADVLPFTRCTAVPGSPPELLGVINLRGEVRCVVELSRLLGLPERDDRPAGYVILLRRSPFPVGLRIDQIEQVQQVSPTEWTTPAEAVRLPGRFVKGVTSDKIRVLSTQVLLSHPEF